METWLSVQSKIASQIKWWGKVPHTDIPAIDRAADLFYSSDMNAACPNSVIEALASGTPIVAFDTGAMRELITGQSGRIVAYGGDPWKLESPDIPALTQAALVILDDLKQYRRGARTRAEEAFDVNVMVNRYLNVLTASDQD
jgi:glycosyltransferase involved in cell wall biosynthesis